MNPALSLHTGPQTAAPPGERQELESSLHLFQPPLYRASDGSWHREFLGAVRHCGAGTTWDPATVLSIFAFGFACGDQTLLREVRRRPWLGRVGDNGEPRLEPIPSHDTCWMSYPQIADELLRRLCDETEEVCRGQEEVWVLLSGGLDSRVAGGVLAQLISEGRVEARPKAVTWGLADSRDVVYGRAAAEALGFEWVHLDVGPAHLIEDVGLTADALGCLFGPSHLHRMPWFRSAPANVLMLAASYGDSVGRAEFSGRRLVDLKYLSPMNRFGILKSEMLEPARAGLCSELRALHERAPGQPQYVQCEHELQAHYMRGLIGHAMSIINDGASVYQLFTHPNVYSFMWSIHPSLRFDEVYAILLERLDPRLARLPWARTNRALKGRTERARRDLRPSFHDYERWIPGPVYEAFIQDVDPDWYAATEIFDADAVRRLGEIVRGDPSAARLHGAYAYELWLWLAAFRRFTRRLEECGKNPAAPAGSAAHANAAKLTVPSDRISRVGRMLRRSAELVKRMRRTRALLSRWHARVKYPPRRARPTPRGPRE